MFKTRYALPGTAPATLTALDPGEGVPPTLRLVEYGLDSYVESHPASVAELPAPGIDDGKVRWIEFNGLGDIEALRTLGDKYGLHPLALEDIIHTGQRPKAESYDGQIFIVAQMIYRDDDDDRLVGEQVSMFLMRGLLITIQEDPKCDVFDPIRERARVGRGYIRKLGADYLAYALLDAIIDHGFPILECIGEGLEELEDEMLEKPTKNCIAKLHDYRRTLVHLRRAIWPERDLVNTLLHDESELIGKETKLFLRDAYDHAVRVMDLVESYRDLTASLLELYLSAVSQRTNEIMRVLTVLSGIFIPLTFIAGVYGMNFDNMPELRQPAGYFACLGFMLCVALGELWFFKRKGWL
ncbi:MAG: magnesium/cobalt transporter CorA [Chthoniobacteraceae bacterium]